MTVVSDPAAIRHILVENAANYRKDDLQLRVLAPGLGRGLLTAEGDEWRLQRRTLAPLFNPRTVAGFCARHGGRRRAARPAVAAAARRPGDRRRAGDDPGHPGRPGAHDLHPGIARDPDALGRAITRYFEAIGPLDPLDISAFRPGFRGIGRLRARPAIRFFRGGGRELIDARKALLARGETAPRDLLTPSLEAADPETGEGLTDSRSAPTSSPSSVPDTRPRRTPCPGRSICSRRTRRRRRWRRKWTRFWGGPVRARSISTGWSIPAPCSTRPCGSIRRCRS